MGVMDQKIPDLLPHELTREDVFRKENVVERFRKHYPYYHMRYSRVPTIDQCAVDDYACFYEANEQFFRDRLVDTAIIKIYVKRTKDCRKFYRYDTDDEQRFCSTFMEELAQARVNYYIKYGELSTQADVRDAFMKQKHRMLWERDNGPVGDKYLQEEMEKAKAREDISVKYKDRIAVRHLSRIFWS